MYAMFMYVCMYILYNAEKKHIKPLGEIQENKFVNSELLVQCRAMTLLFLIHDRLKRSWAASESSSS